MEENKMAKINVKGRDITIFSQKEEDYICITDIARYKNSGRTDDLIRNWLRNRNTIEFLGIWEQLNNPDFEPVEFDGFRKQAGLNSFTLTPGQWIEKTNAIGIISKPAATAEPMLTKISPSNSPHGFPLNLNFISLKSFSDSKRKSRKNSAGISGAISPKSITGFIPTPSKRI
jgi:hypothetical protein